MKQRLIFLLVLIFFIQKGYSQETPGYTAETAFELIETIKPVPFERTTHPDAQWFPTAGMGLFMHWGIHSVAALNPSWSMIKSCFWVKRDCPIATEDYYRLAEEFNPVAYDPEKWVLAAKQAGFQYAVLTAKHHDGYCLWPSKYGEWNTGKYMAGRDLLKPYVDACRKHGLKVGFYFSPRDWADPDFAHVFPYVDNDLNQKRVVTLTKEESQKKFDHFFKTTIGQLSELLTRYGKIDVLWFDGIGWPDVDTYSDEVSTWLRTIQPSMVVNPRWNTDDKTQFFGDYKTNEDSWRKHLTTKPEKVNEGDWWEFCESWSGHWGYSPLDEFRSLDQIVKLMVYARSFGGNYLLNIGPAPDGTMRPGYYSQCKELAEWMEKHKESVIGTTAVKNWSSMSKYPLTKNGQDYYIHLLTDTVRQVEISGVEKPVNAVMLETGEKLSFQYEKGKKLLINLAKERNHPLDAVIKLEF